MLRQRGVVRIAARGQIGRGDEGGRAVDDYVRRDESLPVDGRRSLRDLLPRLRDDREADAARDRLLDLLADILPDLRERRRRHDDRLHRLVDELADLLEDARLRDDRVDELGLALRPQDFVEEVELAERLLQVIDHPALDLAGRFRSHGPRARCSPAPRIPTVRSTRGSSWPARIPPPGRRLRGGASTSLAEPRLRDTRERHFIFSNGRVCGYRPSDTSLYPDGRFPSRSMGSVRPGGLALVASLLLFWTLLPPAIGQGAAGHMVVSSDYELFGLSEPTGGGHVTWTLTEGKAVELRNKILHMFDEYPQIPR